MHMCAMSSPDLGASYHSEPLARKANDAAKLWQNKPILRIRCKCTSSTWIEYMNARNFVNLHENAHVCNVFAGLIGASSY